MTKFDYAHVAIIGRPSRFRRALARSAGLRNALVSLIGGNTEKAELARRNFVADVSGYRGIAVAACDVNNTDAVLETLTTGRPELFGPVDIAIFTEAPGHLADTALAIDGMMCARTDWQPPVGHRANEHPPAGHIVFSTSTSALPWAPLPPDLSAIAATRIAERLRRELAPSVRVSLAFGPLDQASEDPVLADHLANRICVGVARDHFAITPSTTSWVRYYLCGAPLEPFAEIVAGRYTNHPGSGHGIEARR